MLVLYHWDLPKALQDGYGGLLGASFASDFSYFADTAFRLFGPRVKRWLTFIEPAVICNQQYGNGQFAPGVAGGDAARYRCGHNLLLAHGEAVRLYRAKYAASQGGQLSFSTLVTWPQPVSSSSAADKRAAQNKLDAEVGWFLDPVFTGDYPASLKQARAPHLPAFTPAQQQLVRDSLDFIAANAFTSKWVWARPGSAEGWQESRSGPDGRLIGPATGVSWMNDVPSSQGNMLRYLAQRYRGTPLVISSSGTQVPGEEAQRLPGVLDDAFRVSYYRKYLDSVCEAVAAGDVNLLAWYAWSLFDGYEWTDGYSRKFGIVHIAFDDGLKRTPKVSARWLSQHFFKRSA
jgi:beta-glucosidase